VPAPPGAARLATTADRDLLLAWHQAFNKEIGLSGDVAARIDDRLSDDGLQLWYVDDTPVGMAGRSRVIAGMARISSVYTPPRHRRRGYAGALTAAVSQAARDAGATTIVLFTDLSNPTSNRLYPRLGYVPVTDRVLLAPEPRSR
jgi:predicted GNAT family acetyltransferase